MKKYSIIMFAFISLLVTACSNDTAERKIDLTDEQAVKVIGYKKADSVINDVKMETFDIDIPYGGQANSFCIYDSTIFYAVDFSNYFDNPTGEKEAVNFEKKYNTQIRAYDLNSKEDILLYQYEEENCVQVTDMQCNGKELVWEDYTIENVWNIKKMSLAEKSVPEDIVFYEAEKGKMTTATLTITSDGLFWYDQVSDKNDNPINLNKYDFVTKEVSIEKSGLALSSPYEHINIVNEICTTYETNNDNTTTIHIYNLKNKKEINLNVTGRVSNPISDGEICVWMKGYDYQDRVNLFVYDISKETTEKIEVSYAFSYGIINSMVLVNQEEGLLCYDVKNKEYGNLIPTENISYGYTFQGQQNNVYTQKFGEGLKVINLSCNK